MTDLMTLGDLATPWALRVAVTLGIAELIEAGTTDLETLAAKTKSHPEALDAVLSHLAGRGVFTQSTNSAGVSVFGLADLGRELLEPAAHVFFDLRGVGSRFTHVWATLPAYVQTGQPAYQSIFGLPFWEDLAAHPEMSEQFDGLMGHHGHGVPKPLDISVGWNTVRTVVDVGGGSGSMLAEILKAHQHLNGILVDLPQTAARAAALFNEAGVANRATLVGGSFFDELPAGADVYILKSVLNDWPEAETIAILKRVAEAAGTTGLIVVHGGVAPDGNNAKLDLETVLVGGITNGLSAFKAIAAQAGLTVTATSGTKGHGFIVELRQTG